MFDPKDQLKYWNSTKMTERNLYIQLFFRTPLDISAYDSYDKIKLEVLDSKLFMSTETFRLVESDKEHMKRIPT